jgi:hypothetical protein
MSEYNIVDNNSGTIHQIGGRRNVYNASSSGQRAEAMRPAADDDRPPSASGSGYALHAFADMVGYHNLDAQLQHLSQQELADVLDGGIAESGIQPDRVAKQDQGDARLLKFPVGADPARVLSALPRYLNDELTARNRNMAPHAQMRVRVAFTMGVSSPAATGLVGAAVIAVARLANSDIFRNAMRAAPLVQCGVLLDGPLYEECVRQRFRADIDPGDYASVRIAIPSSDFEAAAWMKLFGYSAQQVSVLVG